MDRHWFRLYQLVKVNLAALLINLFVNTQGLICSLPDTLCPLALVLAFGDFLD